MCQEDALINAACEREIRAVSYADILDAANAANLLAEYAAECSIPELGQIAPQREMYRTMEAAGTLHTFGIYRDDTLVGFATLILYVLPHYGRKVAATESIFVTRTYRSSGVGARLLRFIDEYATERGCVAVLYTAPTGSQFDKLLTLKHRRSNSVYIKGL